MNGYGHFLVLLGLFLAALVAIGAIFSRRQRSISDFWLAGRRLGMLNLGFSAAASWLTAGAMLAVVGFFMLSGMGSIWGFVAPNIVALLLIALFVKRIKHLPAITQPELLEQRYGSAIRAPVAVIITVVMILFAVADIKGFAFLLEVYYGLKPAVAALIVAGAVSLYVTLGGLSAVVWTDVIQYLFLAAFAVAMAVVTVGAATAQTAGAAALPVAALFKEVPAAWWNPVSIGIPMVLVFCLAILPGWVSEQDPWQRVWAAKDTRSARAGLVLGAFLIAVVFAACAVIAISLNRIYPDIAVLGFPNGMAKAEPALLNFIVSSGLPPFAIALTAIGLAAAAMSCADTFATSGASCLSRDIYQRYIRPDATMGQMLRVNRVSVLLIVLAATSASFFIDSIIDAIHIATFIASASYFFPLMGGLYWKRATLPGAMAALAVGALSQTALVVVDLVYTAPMAPPFLETVTPLLMGHGVIVGMLASAVAFVAVSMATAPSETVRLAPFFESAAHELSKPEAVTPGFDFPCPAFPIEERTVGERAHLQVNLTATEPLNWRGLVSRLRERHPAWVAPAGLDAIYRLTRPDMLSCVALTRGRGSREIWLRAEPEIGLKEVLRQELRRASAEVASML